MDTQYASPERSDDTCLRNEISFLNGNALINGLLHAVSGLLAVLNEHRQIIALNESLLELLGVGDAGAVLGLRLGEAVSCVHSGEMPGGCGTSEYCSTCGAAIAIVTGLETGSPVEKTCAVTVAGNGGRHDLYFRLRSVPVAYEGRTLVLLFLQDTTYQQRLACLERVFFHDLNGIINGIMCAGELIARKTEGDVGELGRVLYRMSRRLADEVAMQQYLLQYGGKSFSPSLSAVSISRLLDECRDIFANHPAARNRRLLFPTETPEVTVMTDPSLVIRILVNMILNALEAGDEGDEVRVSVDLPGSELVISVRNRQHIPEEFAKRIFQRNFSTKSDSGRGLGTYSMKLFGEEVLGGKVDFTTSEQDGTEFFLRLPLEKMGAEGRLA